MFVTTRSLANVGSYGENTVAEHTFAHARALRRLRDSERAVAQAASVGNGCVASTYGAKLLGWLARAALGFTSSASTGFGMRVLAYDEAPHSFYSELLDFRYTALKSCCVSRT